MRESTAKQKTQIGAQKLKIFVYVLFFMSVFISLNNCYVVNKESIELTKMEEKQEENIENHRGDSGTEERNVKGCITRPKEAVELPSDKYCASTQDNSVGDILAEEWCFYYPLRCELANSQCEPIPFSDSVVYYKEKSRIPIEYNPQTEYNGCLNRGSCAHDGECIRNGSGNHCTSYKVPGFAGILSTYGSPLTNSLCGCVRNRCTWFTQP